MHTSWVGCTCPLPLIQHEIPVEPIHPARKLTLGCTRAYSHSVDRETEINWRFVFMSTAPRAAGLFLSSTAAIKKELQKLHYLRCMHIPARIRKILKPEQLLSVPFHQNDLPADERQVLSMCPSGAAELPGLQDPRGCRTPGAASPCLGELQTELPLPDWGAVQDKQRCHLPFCPGLLFFLHSGRSPLFRSASCQHSSRINRGCFLASLSLHLIRRHSRLLCFHSAAWQSNLHFTGNSLALLNVFYLKWAARRITPNRLAAAAVAQPEPTAEGTPGKATG